METQANPQLHLAYEFVKNTNRNIFLTGKAGTGKTSFLHEIKKEIPKRMVIVAPTGVAAINAGGVTIHSFFQISFGPQLPGEPASQEHGNRFLKISREKVAIIRNLDLLVIDEISMVRADLLDGIDQVIRRFRERDKPFGGVQLLMIGDLLQLPPVVKDDEWQILQEYYQTPYFFSSLALNKTSYVSVELQHVYRQSDQQFINVLNKIRENRVDQEVFAELNRRCIPDFIYDNHDDYIALTTHNYQSKNINDTKLHKLTSKLHVFCAEIRDEFPEISYPTDLELGLKVGAQVMFIKNDVSPEKRFYNGKIGCISKIEGGLIHVKCNDDLSTIVVDRLEWQNIRYTIDPKSKQMVETIIGVFKQYPLKLAWAVTIHKSQGLTFEKAVIDSRAAFAHGQVYVALSRCKTLEGLVLNAPITAQAIKTDPRVIEFTKKASDNSPDNSVLEHSKRSYIKNLCVDLFNFEEISKSVNYYVKILYDNIQSIPEFAIPGANALRDGFRNDIVAVSEKFIPRVEQLIQQQRDLENNDDLQDYIKRACPYFIEKLENGICLYFNDTYFDSDNKKVSKAVSQVQSQISNLIALKIGCLKACINGFNTVQYQKARVNAPIGETEQKKESKKREIALSPQQCLNPDLFTELKLWRAQKAQVLGVATFMILPQKTMYLLANLVPTSHVELKKIHGIGKKKNEDFGSELIEILQRFAKEHNLERNESVEVEVVKKKKPENPTKQITLGMYNDGKSVEVIANERNLAVTTIEGHLAHFVAKGELDIYCILPETTISLISESFSRIGMEKLTPVKEDLGDRVTYGQLRLVQGYLEFVRMQNVSH